MKLKSFIVAVLTLFAAVAVAQDRPTIPILNDVTLTLSCDKALEIGRAHISEMEKVPMDQLSVENVLDRWDREQIALEDVIGPVAILNNTHPDKKVREAADQCMLKISSFTTELFQNEKLYQRVKAVKTSTPVQGQLQRDLLENFEDAGVSLPAAKRARFKEISDRLTLLSQEFGKNVRENATKLTFTPAEYKGLPQSYIDRTKNAEGNVVVGFDYPDYVPFMSSSTNEEARKRYFIAYQQRGTPRNLAILDEMVALRGEIASLYGVPTFAHYVTQRRMVENPDTVLRFLAEVKKAVTEAEKRDIEELRKLKAEQTGQPLARTKLTRWDAGYYREQLNSKRFKVDQEALRKYFPTKQTTEWLIDTTEKLYAVKFERASVPVWHEDVMYFDVKDAATGNFMGGVYLDLFPRDGKYKHAAAWPVRGVSRKAGRTPISVLVTNFDRKGLTHDELETFFHEFGHVIHGVFSETEYNQHAGTSVQRDFVEAPSQIYEEWTRKYDTLSTLKNNCPECPEIDRSLVDRLDAARRFGSGMDYARQHLYSAFDMALAGEKPGKAIEVWTKMEGETPLGYVAGTEFPGTFGHIAGGYAAGYYGYMWSEVVALDMLSAYGNNIMDPAVGQKFRRTILARGGEVPARQLVQEFLGRPVKSDAFFAEIAGTRK